MIRVFPTRTKWTPTDPLAFVGPPPFPAFVPADRTEEVMVSCAFSWDKEIAEHLVGEWAPHFDRVSLGGPAYNAEGDQFVPGRFIKEGVTITSRGCPKECPWCLVGKREGHRMRHLEIKPGHIVQDNNLLACNGDHIQKVFTMLRRQKKGAIFSGGLDKQLFRPWHVDLLRSIRFAELWFACDAACSEDRLAAVGEMLKFVPVKKKRCYVLIGFDGESTRLAEDRLKQVYKIGFLPYAQYYQSLETKEKKIPDEWHDLVGIYSNPGNYRNRDKERERGLIP